jgi:hypothetical protein
VLPAGAVCAQDRVWENREMAATCAMHQIAVIQAAHGDVQGAKRTVSQITDEGERAASIVTVVRCINGQPVYYCPPAGCSCLAPAAFLSWDRRPDRVPARVPLDLPSNYLDPDPRHGPVVDFSDDHDYRGTRVTSRTYADGYAVIETPHPEL